MGERRTVIRLGPPGAGKTYRTFAVEQARLSPGPSPARLTCAEVALLKMSDYTGLSLVVIEELTNFRWTRCPPTGSPWWGKPQL